MKNHKIIQKLQISQLTSQKRYISLSLLLLSLSKLSSSQDLSLCCWENLSISLLFSRQPNRVLGFCWFCFVSNSPSWYHYIQIFYIFTIFPIKNLWLGIFYMFIGESNFSFSFKNLTFNLCISLFFNS